MAIETLQTRVGEIHVIRPDDDPDTVFLRAEVGSAAALATPAHFLRAALAGNRFGLGTNGAVLSLGDDEAATVYLTQRTTADVAGSPDMLEAALQPFAAALLRWRGRLDLEAKKTAEAAEEGEVR